jgi:hypothetical protein
VFKRTDISVNVYRDITKVVGSGWGADRHSEITVFFMSDQIMFCTLDGGHLASLHTYRPNYKRVHEYLSTMANLLENLYDAQRSLDRCFLRDQQADKEAADVKLTVEAEQAETEK